MPGRKAITATLFGAALISGCSRHDAGTYQLPIATAYDRLKDASLVDFRRNRQCGILISLTPEGAGGNQVTWTVRSGGRDMVWFRARLTPVSATETKVAIDIQHGPDNKELYNGEFFPDRPAVAQSLRPAVEEAVDAVLTQRPFDPTHAPSSDNDRMCDDQRGALEEGRLSGVNDPLGAPPLQLPEDTTIDQPGDQHAGFDRTIDRHHQQAESYFKRAYADAGLSW